MDGAQAAIFEQRDKVNKKDLSANGNGGHSNILHQELRGVLGHNGTIETYHVLIAGLP
jgi:hypothetical protein